MGGGVPPGGVSGEVKGGGWSLFLGQSPGHRKEEESGRIHSDGLLCYMVTARKLGSIDKLGMQLVG